ncbi:transformation system protein [Campylobacter sp. MIT 21-1685]|uniref:transformation system protein n=1 Tax=unclassified Campylobacter TaxID=2593542 RepID=UPI00224B1EF8|nr:MULTISPECIES: transformation system protein [unclassified Campylobacter]MCX2683246.1 transformation system protein [Campylobacter sp. MIT 21-1684]MCX2751561.1 transformation system protein [Campylobacter sp. MIT 21-1682]MCX2807760.1 transformation system protein [Campylobacter sp. MIT 21-1685]
MEERIRELEYKYKKYQKKKYLRVFFFLLVILITSYTIYKTFILYKTQQDILNKAFKAKSDLEKQLFEAKIKQEKHKITLQENLEESAKIQINSYNLNVQTLKNAFYQNPSYEKALIIMRIYYDKKSYKKTLFWALKANEFDTSLQEPWIYFAKAKKALGQEKEAKEILELYIQHYGIIILDEEL